MRKSTLLILVVAVAGVAWYQRAALQPFWRPIADRWEVLRRVRAPAASGASASVEMADRAEQKLERMRSGQATSEAFDDLELQSLLQFRYRGLLPAYVDSPRIELDGSRVALRMRVPIDRLPRGPDFGEILALLPDTADFDVHGQLLPADDGHVAFAVDGLSAQRIPLPRRLVAPTLALLGREDRPGLPRDAILIPLPRGARAAYVRGDSLVLLAAAGSEE